MRISDLDFPGRVQKKPKRVGRGGGSGHGKTSGRGHKGQKARSGHKLRPGFEGGQMPIARRLPKRGFRRAEKIENQIVNIDKLNRFKKDSTVTIAMLKEEGLAENIRLPIKILGKGNIFKPLHLQVPAISKQAKEKVEKAGGKVELIKEIKSKENVSGLS